MNQKAIFVYVQAVPIAVPKQLKKFSELDSRVSFRLSHSSRAAIASAVRISESRIIAVGHSSVLREAIARGADEAISVPLCDDPLSQAEVLKEGCVAEGDSLVFMIGENLDGPFSGAALCGALSVLCKLSYQIYDDGENEIKPVARSAILVRDSGSNALNLDIRMISPAFSKEISESSVVGNSTLESFQRDSPDVVRNMPAQEMASIISRRLKRMSV